jgi:hypothetical protein
MRHAISPYLADEITRQRAHALRLLAVAPPRYQAAIAELLRELDQLPHTVAESFLLQALCTPSSRLREIERAVHRTCDVPVVAASRTSSAA